MRKFLLSHLVIIARLGGILLIFLLAPGGNLNFYLAIVWWLAVPRFAPTVAHAGSYRSFYRAGKRLGLSLRLGMLPLHGKRDGFAVTAAPGTTGGLLVRVGAGPLGKGQPLAELSLMPRALPEGFADDPTKDSGALFDRSVDERFNQTFRFMGQLQALDTALGPQQRARLLNLRQAGLVPIVWKGQLLLWKGGPPDEEGIVGLVSQAVELATALTSKDIPVASPLIERALHGSSQSERFSAFLKLAESFPGTDEVRMAARSFLHDEDANVRLRAALAAGDEGCDVLVDLVRAPAQVLPELRARALEYLVRNVPAARVSPLVRESLQDDSGPLRLAAVRAVAVVGDASWEEEVRTILSAGAADERLAAIDALRTFGKASAMPQLRALEKDKSVEPTVRWAAAAAIEKIRERNPQFEAGQVSLADADDKSGRVSIVAGNGRGDVILSQDRSQVEERGDSPRDA